MIAKQSTLAEFLEDLDLYVELVEERQRVTLSEQDAFEKVFHSATVLLRSHFAVGALPFEDLKTAADETCKRVQHLLLLPGSKEEQRQFKYLASDLEFCARRLAGRIANAAQGAVPA